MAEQSRGNFHHDMSTEELMEWLRERGLGEKDLEVVKANGFLGKSFLLTTEDTWKLGEITAEGQVLLNKLVEEARTEERGEVREVPSSRDSPGSGSGQPPPPPAAPSQGRMLTAMATQATPDHSPEYLSFQENFGALVSTFKAQPAAYADILFSNGYIPDEVLEFSRIIGVTESDKSRKILDAIIRRIKLNPSVFNCFITAIAGPFTDDVVKKLHDSYERHKTATSHVEQPHPHQQPPPKASLPQTDSFGSASGQPPPPPAAPSYERIKLSPSDKPYLNALYEAAYSGKNKWLGIGTYLGLSKSDLDAIRIPHNLDVRDCFRAMLLKWFQSSPNCYLDTFLNALRSEPVQLESLCSNVEEAILTIAFHDQKNLDTASDVGGVDLQELMDEYHVDTVQFDREISDNEIPVIAAYFESVELYFAAMGLSAADQADVGTTLLQHDTQTAMARCLRLWKQHRPSMATYRALMELLLKLNRTQVATQVCQYLAHNVPPHESVKSDQQSEPQISTRTDLLGEDGLSDANQKGVDSYVNFWTGKDVLYVYFLNPDILEQEKWECEYGVLNIDNILSWAEAWNPKKFPNIPIFKKTDRADKADIRVKFTGGSCWAKVGSQAMTVLHNEPTMTLALKGLDPKMQKFLVIHQFGHALGLCHEHQSPDFWEVADSLLDVRKMKADSRMKNVNFERDMLEERSQDATFKPEYDPDSVMHYWFDVNWLKNEEHTNLSEVEADGNLSEEEKTVLRGIHKRHLSYADGPSKRDLDFLQEIYASIQTSSIQDQRYLRKLDELMSDKKNTIELQYLKMHFIGPSGIGKTTTRKRLVGSITNLSELPEDQRKRCSTFLAECTQALAFVDLSSGKIKFQRSKDLNEETQLIFSYLMSSKFSKDRTDSTSPAEEGSQASLPSTNPSKETTDEEKQPLKQSDERATEAKTISTKTVPPERKEAVRVSVTAIDVPMVVKRLREIVGGSKDYKESLQNTVLINLVDIGGQPGFMEMFPFLSRGAGIFLAFFRLDKDLDDICQVSYERQNDKITPYDSTYTNRETLSQILSAISHYTKIDTDIDRELCSKLGKLGSAEPIAALIGTFKDELAMQIKVDLLYNILCDSRKASNKSDSTTASKSDSTTADKSYSTTADKSDGTTASKTVSTITSKSDSTTADKSDSTTADKSDNTTASKSDSTTANKTTASKRDSITANSTTASKSDSTTAEHKKAIRLILPQDSQKKSNEQPKVTEQEMAAIKQTISQHLRSDAFKKEVEDRLNQKLDEKSEAMCTITSKFKKLLPTQKDNKKFIAVNNYEGTGSDIDLFCEHLQGMISSFFKDAKLRIRPQQLLLGVVLRNEYDIVSMKDCIRIGTEALEMSEEEVRFTIWYLDRFVGALIYRPDIKDGYFKEFVICNPQVVFNSLSALVVKPLLELHSKDSNTLFMEYVRENWTLRGLFSLKTITKCISEESEEGQLIPVEKLFILLEHSNLLAKIATGKEGHTTDKVEIAYFIPAILKCASPEELTKPPPTGIDTPSPIKITFKPQYVPIGIFCAMISVLVSRGSKGKGILGMTWKLVDSSVKRNLVSFHIDESAKHFVTLIAHVDCYEIRVIRQNREYKMHELCSYVLSTVLFVMKDISPLLTPIIAFNCYCGKQEDGSKLCLLTTGVFPKFTCNCVSPHQKCWFAKEASLESNVSLLALPFAYDKDVKSLSFEWSKKVPNISGRENLLKFKASSNDHFKGFISCNVIKNENHLFTLFYCLKESNAATQLATDGVPHTTTESAIPVEDPPLKAGEMLEHTTPKKEAISVKDPPLKAGEMLEHTTPKKEGVLQKWNLSTRKIICACLVVVVAILYVTGLPDWNTIKFMAKDTEPKGLLFEYASTNPSPASQPPKVPYCTISLGEDETEASSDANQEGASGFALKTNIWTGKDVLFVHFLNPKILEQKKWENEYGVLNIGNILSWAEAWNTKKYPNIPTFKKTDRPDRADIRVKFEGGTSWSMVGRQAKAVQDISEPTMILSLKGLDHKMQKFLVMHEFGHALGLFHEHQRSDFWEVANSLLDVRKMKNDPRMKKVNFNRDILEKQPQDAMVMTPEYDPDSIMHYWFDVNWLKNTKHKSLSKVEADGSLSEDQKNVLRGIHKRHLSYADSPSQEDLDFLDKIYDSTGSASGQPPPPPAAPSNERIKLSDDKNLYFNPLHDAAFNGRNKWYNIGIRLKISVADLESFKTNNPLNVEGCFIAMLNKWFDNNDNCYLDTFLTALRSDSVGLSNLCSKVKEAILAAKRAQM